MIHDESTYFSAIDVGGVLRDGLGRPPGLGTVAAAECAAFLRFMQGMESILERRETPKGNRLPRGFDAERWLIDQWRTIGPIWQRVYWAGQMAIENACDPNATTLEWRDELKEAAGRIER